MTNITLDDQAMQGFIRDGYVVVQPELDADFHQHVFDSIDHVFETEGNPGNNLMARISAIGKVWSDPAVDGAMQSILGRGYYMHPHRHCHYRPPGGEGQTLHKDGFSKRRHRTRWTLAMYYPQETTLEMGPTAIVPGSHYFNTEAAGTAREEMALPVPAGSVAIVDYDIWHRGTANESDRKRYMVKFLFVRMEEPPSPSWEGPGAEWRPQGGHEAMWSSMWDWHTGGNGHDSEAAPNGQSVDDLLHTVVNAEEKACLDAAYELAGVGEPAVAPLMDALQADYGDASPTGEVSYGKLAAADRPEQIRRNISYALGLHWRPCGGSPGRSRRASRLVGAGRGSRDPRRHRAGRSGRRSRAAKGAGGRVASGAPPCIRSAGNRGTEWRRGRSGPDRLAAGSGRGDKEKRGPRPGTDRARSVGSGARSRGRARRRGQVRQGQGRGGPPPHRHAGGP